MFEEFDIDPEKLEKIKELNKKISARLEEIGKKFLDGSLEGSFTLGQVPEDLIEKIERDFNSPYKSEHLKKNLGDTEDPAEKYFSSIKREKRKVKTSDDADSKIDFFSTLKIFEKWKVHVITISFQNKGVTYHFFDTSTEEINNDAQLRNDKVNSMIDKLKNKGFFNAKR